MSEQRYRWPQMGQLFVEKGRLTSEQLDSALAQQKETGEPLGEILVARNHITRIDLAAALSTQWSWQGDESAEEETPEQPAAAEPAEARAGHDGDAAVAERTASAEDDDRLVADLQARLRGAYEQLAAAEARLEVLEPAVDDLTKAFGVLNAQLHARGEELAELRAASAKREEQIAAAARALLG
jgi:predicted  nucleic acid-binding Zn-ribbon protein